MAEQPPTPDSAMSETADAAKPWWKKPLGIFGIALAVLIVFSMLSANGDSNGDEDASVVEPEEEPEQVEESEEPEPVAEAEPEPEPEPEPTFEPVVFEGTGDSIIDVPAEEGIPLVVTFTHDGSRNFAVTSYNTQGDRVNLMVNTIGNYEGTVPYNFEDTVAELEISADGAWTATISDARDQPTLSGETTGTGDEILWVGGQSGRLTASHDGERNFAVLGWGQRRQLLVNDIGSYSGTVRMDDAVALEINADGNWTFTLE